MCCAVLGPRKKTKKTKIKKMKNKKKRAKEPCPSLVLLHYCFSFCFVSFLFSVFFFILVSEWKGGGGWWFFFLIQNFESIHDEYLAQANESQRKIHWNELDLQKKKIDQSRHEAKKKNASVADTGRRFQLRRTRKARATTE